MTHANGANTQIYYGKPGDIATNRRDETELSVLCLHLLQAAMVYINTLMIKTPSTTPPGLPGSAQRTTAG